MRLTLRGVKQLLWFLLGLGAVAIAARLITGLGTVTDLSHQVSWGLWNAAKISIVPLSAGGFVMAGIVYVLRMEKLRPLLRLSILTGFLGYSTFATMLLFDIGIPYRIWHPMVYWQHHSVLFEVAWCVMLYLTVLALEFAPVALEYPLLRHPLVSRVHGLLKKATVPLVMCGIVLSTLHQSSLGSLFLITPHRLDPLWYSPLIYLLFYLSAIGMGLLVVVVQAILFERFYGVELPKSLLEPLVRFGALVMALFFALRLGDQAFRGILPGALGASSMAGVFLLEAVLCAACPVLLLSRRVRSGRRGLFWCSLAAVLGVVLYRSSVALLAVDWGPKDYFPAWTEFALMGGILAGTVLVFLFLVENLDIYFGPATALEERPSWLPGVASPGLQFEAGLADARITAFRRHSLAMVAGATLAVFLLPEEAVHGARPSRTPVLMSRALEGQAERLEKGKLRFLSLNNPGNRSPDRDSGTRLLLLDGNRGGDAVLFDHKDHARRMGGKESCALCHHLNMPLDRDTSCAECHRDMYEPTNTFDHQSHIAVLHGRASCVKCHSDASKPKVFQTAAPCSECHEKEFASDRLIARPEARWRPAAGYMKAMHGLCVECHQKKAKEQPSRHPAALGRCAACHDSDLIPELQWVEPHRARADAAGLGGA